MIFISAVSHVPCGLGVGETREGVVIRKGFAERALIRLKNYSQNISYRIPVYSHTQNKAGILHRFINSS